MERSAGILLPVFSLPGAYGIGTLGREARAFADFLRDAGQRWWQVLPVGPTGAGNSPYTSASTFAGNPLLIDLGELCQEGPLKKGRCKRPFWGEGASVTLADTNWTLVAIFGVCVLLLRKFKMNPVWVMLLAGLLNAVLSYLS